MMNNKRLGTDFEREFCEILAKRGAWVHFIAPDARGAQPFDVIAVKDGFAYAYDCKTSVQRSFPFSRLEDNQILAFERWMRCGNAEPMIAVRYAGQIYLLPYTELRDRGKIRLAEKYLFEGGE